MIQFLLKGILRDRSRSLLPIIIVAIGVMLTVMLTGYVNGMMGEVVRESAKFDTGHVKVMSRAYAENIEQIPNDLALDEVESLLSELRTDYPDVDWVQRIKFGGLIDVLDEQGKQKGQGPVAGLSFELYSGNKTEVSRLGLEKAVVKGSIPDSKREILISSGFAEKLELDIGDEVTYVGSTMNGSMAFSVFTVSGFVQFGISQMDKGTIILDVSDAKSILDMEDSVGEILGYLPNDQFDKDQTLAMAASFNEKYKNNKDEFAPVMKGLTEQGELKSLMEVSDGMSFLLIGIFLFAMSIVLWNTGLIAGLRRYKEFGIRLALGESKGHIYRTFTMEAIIIGIIGTIIGTTIGIAFIWYLQEYGIDISKMLEGTETGLMLPNVIRSQVTPNLFFIGFIPGLFAMVFGNMLSGIGIYKRETASLFKELEV